VLRLDGEMHGLAWLSSTVCQVSHGFLFFICLLLDSIDCFVMFSIVFGRCYPFWRFELLPHRSPLFAIVFNCSWFSFILYCLKRQAMQLPMVSIIFCSSWFCWFVLFCDIFYRSPLFSMAFHCLVFVVYVFLRFPSISVV
jgi:hypothetical protein